MDGKRPRPDEIRRYIEAVYSRHPWLRPAKHIVVVFDRIVYDDIREGRRIFFSGLQPSWRSDIIVLSWPSIKRDTIVHETIHTYGFGETVAWSLAPILSQLRERFPPIVRRKVRYRVCGGGCELDELHKRFGSKILHLVLEE